MCVLARASDLTKRTGEESCFRTSCSNLLLSRGASETSSRTQQLHAEEEEAASNRYVNFLPFLSPVRFAFSLFWSGVRVFLERSRKGRGRGPTSIVHPHHSVNYTNKTTTMLLEGAGEAKVV